MVYQSTNRFQDALDSYNQSLIIEREIGNKAGEALTLHQIDMVYQLTSLQEEKSLDPDDIDQAWKDLLKHAQDEAAMHN